MEKSDREINLSLLRGRVRTKGEILHHSDSLSSRQVYTNTTGCINKCYWRRLLRYKQRRGEKKREQQRPQSGSWKVYHLTGLDAVCIALCASLRHPPKDARALSTMPHTRRTLTGEHSLHLSVLLQDTNLSRWRKTRLVFSPACVRQRGLMMARTRICEHPFFPVQPQKTDYSTMVMVQQGIDSRRPHWVVMIQPCADANRVGFTRDRISLLPLCVSATLPLEYPPLCLDLTPMSHQSVALRINDMELLKQT